jgi:hypothetical protein
MKGVAKKDCFLATVCRRGSGIGQNSGAIYLYLIADDHAQIL